MSFFFKIGFGLKTETLGLKPIENTTFIHLKVPTRSSKTIEEEAKQWLNDSLSR
jgi:hypothetical protein